MNRFFFGFQKAFRRRPVFFGLMAVLFFLGLSFGAFQLKLSEDARAILPHSEQADRLNDILEHINLSDRVFFNIYLKDSSETQQKELIKFAKQLSDSLASSKNIKEIRLNIENQSIEQVSSYVLRNLPFLLEDSDYAYFDTIIEQGRFQSSFKKKYKSLLSPASVFLKKLVIEDPAGLSLKALERLRGFQIDQEISIDKGFLFTQDKKHLLFFLTPIASSSETAQNAKMVLEIENYIQDLEEQFEGRIVAEYFGAPVVAAGNAEQIKKDIILTVSMAFVMVVLLIAFFYKSKRLYFIIFLPAALAVITSMAVLYLLKGEISAIALGLGSVLVGISIDYVLHIFTHFQKTNSIKKVLEDVSEPILISAATTATAFLGLLVVSASALQDMGWFAGLSIIFSALFSLIFIPLFLKEKKEGEVEKIEKLNFVQKLVNYISNYPFHQKTYLILAILILSPVFYYFSKEVKFQGDMNEINFMKEKTSKAEQHLNEITKLSQRNIYVVALGEDLESVLQNNEAFEKQLSKLDRELVMNFTSVSSILPSQKLQKEKIEKWKSYWTADKQQILLSQLVNIEKNYGFKSGSFDKFKNWFHHDFNTISDSDTQLIREAFLSEFLQGTEEMPMAITQIKTSSENKHKLHHILDKELHDAIYIIDKEYLTTQFVKQLQDDFQWLVNLTLLLVFLIIWMSFGRIELAIITYLPLVLSWVWTTGLMALLGLEFNIVNIIISTFIFGLGIDYCIFITRGLMQEYKYGEEKLDSFKTSILFSAVTSMVGIGVLLFAKHPALQSMAFVTIIGLSSVFILSFSLQPLLFYWLINVKKGQRRLVPVTAMNLLGSIIALLVFTLGSLFNTIAGFFLIILTGGKSKRTRLWFHKLLVITSRIMIYIMFNVKKNVMGFDKKKFEEPAVIISNHQSHIDIMLMLMLHPKMILLTNDWVQRNFFYGFIVKMADFYPILDHLHAHVDLLKKKTDEGYSVMVFPEGTRSVTGKIGRFHKGAFYLAEQLNLDVLPIILHGPGHCITKGEPFLKSGRIDVKIGERIALDDKRFGEGYVQRSKKFRTWYQEQLEEISDEVITPNYMRKRVDMNYIYKGPVLEWYVKIKMNFEKNYEFFNQVIPQDAHIIDLGCGNGMLDYMLMMLSNKRSVLGVDYDEDKIQVAQNNSARKQFAAGQVEFESADLNHWEFQKADVYVLADVLHYMPENEQEYVIKQSAARLNAGGMLIIRDADTSLEKKHRGTKFSEWQSTKFFGFNKTKDDNKQLYFGTASDRISLLESLGLQVELIDHTKMNSNVVIIGRKG